jgi:nucleoside-diphosphate-sugar epimerase
MRILFTGASSFTGYWFIRELIAAGHEVVAAFRGDGRYEGVRALRAQLVRELCETRNGCAFGSDDFLTLVKSSPGSFDVLCHHAAEVGDYRSPDFDPYRAAAANLHRLPDVLRTLKDRGCGRFVLTGSVFEANEGAGSAPLCAFSPYGLSKTLTATAAQFYAEREGFTFEKFVIPNPFGPYEEPRFTSYLMRTWLAGGTVRVQTPRYVRDNVPVSLLAEAYAGFVSATPPSGVMRRLNPSFYPESQGAFAERVRREAEARLERPCRLEFGEQTQFPEPPVRINTDPLGPHQLRSSETQAWDGFVEYYATGLARPSGSGS